MTIKADRLDTCDPLHSRRPPLCYSRPHAVGPVPNHNDARVGLTTLTIVTGAALWLIVCSGMVSDLAT
jgi:hypothetical protein